MNYIKTNIPEVILLEPTIYGDHRGFFMETWRDQEFKEQVAEVSFVQDNHSRSSKGTLRGLHYQLNKPQGKLVRVTQGSVFDVAVDMRRNSPTFGQWVGFELSEENHRMLWVPEGFAHGFLVLSEYAEFSYKCTDYYAPHDERCLKWNDPKVGITWPTLDISADSLLVSEKDQHGASFEDADSYNL